MRFAKGRPVLALAILLVAVSVNPLKGLAQTGFRSGRYPPPKS